MTGFLYCCGGCFTPVSPVAIRSCTGHVSVHALFVTKAYLSGLDWDPEHCVNAISVVSDGFVSIVWGPKYCVNAISVVSDGLVSILCL